MYKSIDITNKMLERAAQNSGISEMQIAEKTLRCLLQLKTNDEICNEFRNCSSDNFWQKKTRRRSIVIFLRLFILYNYQSEFKTFLIMVDRNFFNEDLEVPKKHANLARFIFILFLREVVGLKASFKLIPPLTHTTYSRR